MNGFTRTLSSVALLAAACAVVADEPRIFIPWSPLDESELAQERAKMKRAPALSDAFIEQELKNVATFHAYRDADIVKAFPQVRGHRKLSACTNSMMSGATEFVYLSNKAHNQVTFETIRCDRATNGLKCWPLQRETRFFLDGSDRYFLLENVTLDEARRLIETYEAGRIANPPDWMHPEGPKISLIKAMPDGQYLMIFGDYLCAGCVSKIMVKPETVNGETRLAIQGQPDMVCI